MRREDKEPGLLGDPVQQVLGGSTDMPDISRLPEIVATSACGAIGTVSMCLDTNLPGGLVSTPATEVGSGVVCISANGCGGTGVPVPGGVTGGPGSDRGPERTWGAEAWLGGSLLPPSVAPWSPAPGLSTAPFDALLTIPALTPAGDAPPPIIGPVAPYQEEPGPLLAPSSADLVG